MECNARALSNNTFNFTPHVTKNVLTLSGLVRRHRMAYNAFLALNVLALYPPAPGFPLPWRVFANNSTNSGASDPLINSISSLVSCSSREEDESKDVDGAVDGEVDADVGDADIGGGDGLACPK
mmetsp:Transcript_4352/g.6636  ORF Transcript_4352/g.6636 Transcript_4352/m.6636 type:complete len:124 (-) Transcript_4352:726-1097(-)